MKLCLVIPLILVVIIIIVVMSTKKEGFTLHKIDGLLCKPFLNGNDAYLMPDSVVFVIQGYNYSETPKIFRDDKLVVPLQYAWDYSDMAYYMTIYAPKGLCESEWILETSNFVEPVVYEGRSERKLNVTLKRRRNGFHKWALTC